MPFTPEELLEHMFMYHNGHVFKAHYDKALGTITCPAIIRQMILDFSCYSGMVRRFSEWLESYFNQKEHQSLDTFKAWLQNEKDKLLKEKPTYNTFGNLHAEVAILGTLEVIRATELEYEYPVYFKHPKVNWQLESLNDVPSLAKDKKVNENFFIEIQRETDALFFEDLKEAIGQDKGKRFIQEHYDNFPDKEDFLNHLAALINGQISRVKLNDQDAKQVETLAINWLNRQRKLLGLDVMVINTKSENILKDGKSKIKWKGNQTELTELIKSLIESGSIQGSQKEIVETFTWFLNTEINGFDKKLQNIKGRNTDNETTFLDNLKDGLMKWMEK